ncbi:MAG TPA: hypothetical protein VHX19_09630 [Stellaceae bacterium]|nr:hypothetical protein [Stellaceae bacterium]
MSNIQNDAKKVVTDTTAAVTIERRHLVARLMLWLRAHPHTILAIAAAAVILAVTFGVIRG